MGKKKFHESIVAIMKPYCNLLNIIFIGKVKPNAKSSYHKNN